MASRRDHIRLLRRQMDNNMVRSESGRYFLPYASFATIVSSAAIDQVVNELTCTPDERIGLADKIDSYGKRLFAILVWMKEEDFIVNFRNHDVLDRSLPLSESDARELAPDFGSRLAREEQWRFLPYYFPHDMCEHHREIDKNMILPFVGESEQVGRGAFGEIHRVNIEPSEQALFLNEKKQIQIVRKSLRSRKIKEEFNHERACLRLLNQLKHPNIIPLLGSYSYAGELYFLFPYVGIDLRAFLQKEERVGNFQRDFTFYSALRGLCSALANTHSLHLSQKAHGISFEGIGYHHDIRPANILVNDETFVLADFGLGNLKAADAQSQTLWKPTAGDYLAPECMDEEYKTQNVNRAIDVWAFGCLIGEVVTYVQRGPRGVQEFSDRRLSPGRMAHWEDCMFYGADGKTKDEVIQWLGSFSKDNADGILLGKLAQVSLRALTSDPMRRPKAGEIQETLAFLSLEAHFASVCEQLSSHVTSYPPTGIQAGRVGDNLWFQQERLRAWGRVLGLGTEQASLSESLERIYDESIDPLKILFHELKGATKALGNSDAPSLFENRVDRLIESLWALLPRGLKKLAEDHWHQAILSTDNKKILNEVQQKLKSRYITHDLADALAMMRKLRLEVLQPDTFEGADEACSIKLDDVKYRPKGKHHVLGTYKDKIPILVERVRHTPAWDKVNLVQRKLVVSLKAKSLSINPKPDGLRALQCLGVFEEPGSKPGFGFVYQYPSGSDPESDPTTLLQRLVQEEKTPKAHPLLGEKFKLAFALADFLKEFHTIGWLHESFNSHNVVFFKPVKALDEDISNLEHSGLQQPFIVGLHKSRPDGSFWQTDGPDTGDNLQDYQHPSYAGTGRYRLHFDYYSLGVVLLEIGLWRPLKSILSGSKLGDAGLARIRAALIERCEERLGPKMGAVYRDVVVRCMDGSLGLNAFNQEARGEELPERIASLGRFTENVVEPLGKLAMAPI